ncbi:MAG: thiamine-phosphate kinase [Dehalococcoidia bacterium]|nr:thiamine-phosphate kinase [Dehalococcoidia bacterium]
MKDQDSFSNFGEFTLINKIIEQLGSHVAKDIFVPPGDDAAAWINSKNSLTVATVDTLTEGTHWRPDTMNFNDVGWRAVTASVSDLAAMGATPTYLLIAITLDSNITDQNITMLTEGIAQSSAVHNVKIAGGDIIRAHTNMISVTAIGEILQDNRYPIMRRTTAEPDELIAISGYPGTSGAGLAIIEEGQREDGLDTELITLHRQPVARVQLGIKAAKAGIKCAIDLSDGLVQDLEHIAKASNIGIEIDTEKIPLHNTAYTLLGREKILDLALGEGGEDFELILIGKAQTLRSLHTMELPVTLIGRTVSHHPGQVKIHDSSGKEYEPPQRGWDHLRND